MDSGDLALWKASRWGKGTDGVIVRPFVCLSVFPEKVGGGVGLPSGGGGRVDERMDGKAVVATATAPAAGANITG